MASGDFVMRLKISLKTAAFPAIMRTRFDGRNGMLASA
jgi:hypothetical protein